MPFVVLLILFASFPPHVAAVVATPDPAHSPLWRTEGVPLLPFASVAFTDEPARTPPPPERFRPAESPRINRGYDTRTLWIRFTLQNDRDEPLAALLSLGNPTLDRVVLYRKRDRTFVPFAEAGTMTRHPPADGIVEPHFLLTLKPHTRSEFLLSVESGSSALRLAPRLSEPSAFFREAVSRQMFVSLFFGAMGALIAYNFFVFLFTRQKAYLYYSLFHLFAVVNYLSYTSTINLLLPPSLWEVDAYLAVFYQSAGIFFMLLFARSFLLTERYEKAEKIFRALLAATGLLAIWGILFPSSFPILLSIFLAAASILWVLALSWYLAYRKERNGPILALSWSFATLGFVSLALYDAGFPSPLERFPRLYEWSLLAEALLFSLALSRKLNLTRRLAAALRRNEYLLKELNHRTKNNMQFITSLYRMKLADLDDERTNRKLQEAENAVWAIRSVHEMLYDKSAQNPLNMQSYLEMLTRRLREGLGRFDVRFRIEARPHCDAEEAMKIGTILNELISNAFKHAFPSRSGENLVEIELNERNGERRLLFRDNGVGCRKEDGRDDGFGLRLVVAIVEKELGGTLEKSE
ncbi:7TM diverse intracellular signaling domain-containing protein, partial [Hydrogenimonas sp.]